MMKKLLIAIGMLALVAHGQNCSAEENTLYWCGLDYKFVKMIGTTDFNKPDEIFPEALQKWNALFMKEMLPKVEKMAPGLGTDLAGVAARNDKASVNQVIREDGTEAEMVKPSDITESMIEKEVKELDLKHKDGMGLVFIMDRLVKSQEKGTLYVVYFDIATRKVLYSERFIEKAGGAGFRNFWFMPIKKTVEKLPATYSKAKAAR